MSFKDILVIADNSKGSGRRLHFAADLAARHGAHLTGLFVFPMPTVPNYISEHYTAAIGGAQEEFIRSEAADAEQQFRKACEASGIPGEWRAMQGEAQALAVEMGRYVDLVVCGQGDPEEETERDLRRLTSDLLLGVGRPVLVVPYVGTYPADIDVALVGWNGSREAARAVNDAIPLIERARRVHVVSVGSKSGNGEPASIEMAHHLARHGIDTRSEHLPYSSDISAADAMLSRAADEGANLLVLGAYGRGRLTEVVLGGVTREILDHMTLPVLFSH